ARKIPVLVMWVRLPRGAFYYALKSMLSRSLDNISVNIIALNHNLALIGLFFMRSILHSDSQIMRLEF
ncbi:MAG: hypothetical protein ABF741_12200, partial [Liquorilactobacillus ghanensis]|uniref:hypothetical protein n=1 Tax=Liquorilactobacillus ghanensis TaxID=399370 RepID=UPI0039E9B213